MRGKKKNRLPPFVFITKEMLNSDAFKELTNASRIAYLLLQAQICKSEQTTVKFPYLQAVEYMDKQTFTRSIRQLVESGFVKKEQEGGLFRRTNVYTFTDYWRQFKKQ